MFPKRFYDMNPCGSVNTSCDEHASFPCFHLTAPSVSPRNYLTSCFLVLPPHAISGWDKKQTERWVIASIFLLHDLCCTRCLINIVWISPFISLKRLEALTYLLVALYSALQHVIFLFFCFFRSGLILELILVSPRSSVWSAEQPGGLFLVQGRLHSRWGKERGFSFASPALIPWEILYIPSVETFWS